MLGRALLAFVSLIIVAVLILPVWTPRVTAPEPLRSGDLASDVTADCCFECPEDVAATCEGACACLEVLPARASFPEISSGIVIRLLIRRSPAEEARSPEPLPPKLSRI